MDNKEAFTNLVALDAVCGQKDFYDDEFREALLKAEESLLGEEDNKKSIGYLMNKAIFESQFSIKKLEDAQESSGEERLRYSYLKVFENMMTRGCNLLLGHYDAKNGKPEYMYGVQMVMEYMAYRCSDEIGDAFGELFVSNMIESERKVNQDEY